ncbi:MAG: radical SAM protein [Bacteriovoracia bacterium]
MRTLLLIPPMVQVNTPYPATAYLTGFLKSRGHDVVQADPSVELICRLFSANGLQRVREALPSRAAKGWKHFDREFARYEATVEPVLDFLRGRNPSLANRIVTRNFLPEGPRFHALSPTGTEGEDSETLGWAFGALGVTDQAKHLASLYLDDLADVIRLGIDPYFEFSRYGEKLAASQASFDPLREALLAPATLVSLVLEEITVELLREHRPSLVGLTVPFPGNVYGAFRMAAAIRREAPTVKIALGGGYVNTELRELSDPRVFDWVDFITYDDGERPLECLIEHLAGKRPREELLRTAFRELPPDGKRAAESDGGVIRLVSSPREHDVPLKQAGFPTYAGLPLDRYIPVFEMLNPMNRLWTDFRWNKLTLAHGCYWKKCTFCDTSLDYIGRYDPLQADAIIDRMEALIRETGQSGFHFVDEAAPPAILRGLSERLLARKVVASWWGNIRFEKTFTPELARLMAEAGCIAVTGGLEVASDRVLKLINKGVSIEQVVRVTRAFRDAGIFVHAYLMYGFPTQTVQETVDSLEVVRQLFSEGCLHSGFWHRFSATVHSPVGRDPKAFGIRLREGKTPKPGRFARNDLPFEDPTLGAGKSKLDHAQLGEGLRRAIYNYMHGVGLDQDVHRWFDVKVPATKVSKTLVQRCR